MERPPCSARKSCATVRDAIGRDHVNCLRRLNYYMGSYEVTSQCARKGSMQCLLRHLRALVDESWPNVLESSWAYMENVANVAAKQDHLDVLRELRKISFWRFNGHNIYSKARDRGNNNIARWCFEEGLVECDGAEVALLIRTGNIKMVDWLVENGLVKWPANCYHEAIDTYSSRDIWGMVKCLRKHGAPLGDIVSPGKYGEVLIDRALRTRQVPDKGIDWLREHGAQWTQESLSCGVFGDRDLVWMLEQGCPVGSKELLSRRLAHRVSQLDWAASVPLELDTDVIAQEAIKWGNTKTLDWLIQRGELAKADVDVSLCQFALNREHMAKWKMQ